MNPRSSLYFQESGIEMTSITALLKTPSSQRPPGAVKSLQNLTKNIPFFKQLICDYEERAHLDCCMCLKYLFMEKDTTVCNVGEEGDLFYIILQGLVRVIVPDEITGVFRECTKLMAGCAFGEFALLRNKPRSATVICIEPTHFAVLSKKDFLRILGTFTNRKLEEIARFLKGLPIFSGWVLNSLVRLSYYFRLVRFKRNQKVFREGSIADYVYIVSKGEFEIEKEIIVKSTSQVVIGHFGRPLKSTRKKDSHHQGRISIVGAGEIIGDDDAYNGQVYTTSCRCYTATAEVLQISSHEFKRRIKNEDSLSVMAEQSTFRNLHLDSAMKMIKEIQSPRERIHKNKSSSDLKLIADIKSMNFWNSSMKSCKVLNSELGSLHKPSASVALPMINEKFTSPRGTEKKSGFFNANYSTGMNI